MIYSSQSNISESQFVSLLHQTKKHVLKALKEASNPTKLEGVVFEDLVYQSAVAVAKGTIFENNLERTSLLAFPDIIAQKYYGIEVKVTTSNKWVSTGNSITETTRIQGVERIYMFFGKLGGEADVKFRPYQECLSEVGVTHSPRYKIDMNLVAGQSIFDKMGVDYSVLRTDGNPIRIVKDYYRSLLEEGEELWWIDQHDEAPASPIIRPFQSLSKEDQESFIVECMALFPEIFGSSQKKYERVAAYLVTSRNAVSANIRDYFSASGQVKISVNDKSVIVPRVFEKLYRLAPKIKTYIESAPRERLASYWNVQNIKEDALSIWHMKLTELTSTTSVHTFSANDIFVQGLRHEKTSESTLSEL